MHAVIGCYYRESPKGAYIYYTCTYDNIFLAISPSGIAKKNYMGRLIWEGFEQNSFPVGHQHPEILPSSADKNDVLN